MPGQGLPGKCSTFRQEFETFASRLSAEVHQYGVKGEQSKESPQGTKPWDEDRAYGLPAMDPAQL